MTETPPPGYITDDGEGVASPGSHSSGESTYTVRLDIVGQKEDDQER